MIPTGVGGDFCVRVFVSLAGTKSKPVPRFHFYGECGRILFIFKCPLAAFNDGGIFETRLKYLETGCLKCIFWVIFFNWGVGFSQ